MSQIKRGVILAIIFALILVAILAGTSYHFFPHEAPQPSPPTPATAPTPATPPPVPTPMPTTPVPFPTATPPLLPTPIPEPIPTPFLPSIEVEVASLEGFDYTEIGGTYPEKVPVLHQGTSGNITIKVHSRYNESYVVSLSLSGGYDGSLESVNCRFYPSTLELPSNGTTTATLTLEAELNAPNNLISPLLEFQIEEFQGTIGVFLGFKILVFPKTPAYIFELTLAEPMPTPTQTAINETTPPPFPTPFPTPIHWTPQPYEPLIEVEKGGQTQILFHITYYIGLRPSSALSLNCQTSTLPEGMKAEITLDPLKTFQNAMMFRSILLTLKVDAQTPEGICDVTAKITLNQIVCERIFHLKVTG